MMASRGFTLLELMVVLVILTLIAALAPPLLSGLGITTELRGSARQLAAGLRAARSAAITQQRAATVTVDLENRTFKLSSDPRIIGLPSQDKIEIKLYTAQSELLSDKTGNIRFFPDGSSTGGHITLADDKIEYRVNVDWLTGRVNIEDRDVQ